MRRQNKILIWPLYFDSSKTRMEGRRVPKSLAVSSPSVFELKACAEKLGLKCEVMADAFHPKMPWFKVGVLVVEKTCSKEKALKMFAEQLLKIRSAASEKTTR